MQRSRSVRLGYQKKAWLIPNFAIDNAEKQRLTRDFAIDNTKKQFYNLGIAIELQYSAVTGLTEMSAFQRESRLVQGFYVKFRYAAPELCVIKHSVFLR